jgi:flagellar biosynthesis/type III secretory pathway protein FliH
MFRVRQAGEEVRPFVFDRVLAQEGEEERRFLDLDKMEEQAYTAGYEDGAKAGFASGMAKAEKLLHRLEGLVFGLEKTRAELYGKLEQEILDLVIRIAEKVIHAEIRSEGSTRTSILEAGLRKLKDSEKLLVRVAPADLRAIEEVLPVLKEQNGIVGKVTLREDPEVSEGGCVLESDQCEVDGRIEVTLRAIEEALKRP